MVVSCAQERERQRERGLTTGPADMAYGAVPQEIVNVLPSEPLQQLEIAQKIINQAYSNKFSQSEQEAAHLRQTLTQRNGQVRIWMPLRSG